MSTRQNAIYPALALLALAALLILFLLALPNGASSSIPSPPRPLAPPEVRFSLPSGPYDGPITIRLSADPGATIYFTTDGSLPTPETSTRYDRPIRLPGAEPGVTVLRARAAQPETGMGPVRTATYFHNLDSAIPALSLVVDPEDLWDDERGILANATLYGREWEREGEIFYYDPQLRSGVEAPAGVRVHGARSRAYAKKSLRLYFRDEYGVPFLEFPIFPDYATERFKRLVLHDGGQDFPAVSYNGTLLRNELLGSLAREAGAFAGYSRPALLFLNGEPWGIYNIRERIDARYLAEKFGIESADLLSGFEFDLEAATGDNAHWDNLMAYVNANDLSQAEHYAYIETQVNLDNFIDYAAIQIISANADWPHNNQLKFRDRASGRWHWIFWDTDFAFGLMPDSYIEKNMFSHVFDQEDERLQQSSLLLRKLLEHPDFKRRFLNRLADLLNTVFASDHVLAELNGLAAGLEQDIPWELRRWPGAGDWHAGVEYMRAFARQRPDIVRAQAVEAFGLPGTALLTIEAPDGQGTVAVNDMPAWGASALPLAGLPWQGTYFQDVAVEITAVPDPGYRFAGWEPAGLPDTAQLTLLLDGDLTLRPRFEAENSAGPPAGSVVFSGYSRAGGAITDEAIEGEWVALTVRAPLGVDLRGWRVTDKDTPDAQDEGSLIIGDDPALARVPPGTTVLLALSRTAANDFLLRQDDLNPLDGRLVLYAGNDQLDTQSDPWFRIGTNDSLTLLAPAAGEGQAWATIDRLQVEAP